MNRLTSKIGTIIRHEYLMRIKTKGFLIGTIFGPLILVAIIGIPVLLAIVSEDSTEKKIAILDETDKYGEMIVAKDSTKFFLTGETESQLKADILSEKLDGYLFLPEDIIESGEATVYTRGGGGLGFITSMERNLGRILWRQRLLEADVDTSVINLVAKGVEVHTQKITEEGEQKDYTEAFAFIGYILGFMIYGMMFAYGGLVMRGVIEEKTNRIVEIIASSAKPFEIMFGKVVGIGAVGLTQVVIWLIFAALGLTFAEPVARLFMEQPEAMQNMASASGQSAMPPGFEIPEVSPWLFVSFIFYFLAGYFIYSSLFAAIGSAVDQEQDAAQLQMPVTLPIILPILFIFNIMSNPDSVLAIVMSLIPFFSPILMIVRIAATDVPAWQIVTSVVLLILTFFGCLWVAAKIYRVGILMTGKKPSFKDLIKWAKS